VSPVFAATSLQRIFGECRSKARATKSPRASDSENQVALSAAVFSALLSSTHASADRVDSFIALAHDHL
jgi:hypothetical protein